MHVWLADKLIDTQALWNVIWASIAAGVGGTAALSLAIVGATRFADLRRAGRGAGATLFAIVAITGVVICIGISTLGLYAIVNK